MAEMCAGILVAVADHDRFDGALMLDVAGPDELCEGMGGREMRTVDGEIVLRDEKEIVACCARVPMKRPGFRIPHGMFSSMLTGIPGVTEGVLKEGLSIAAETMAEFGNGTVREITLY